MQFLSIIWSDIQLVVTRKLNSLAFIVKRHVFLGELFPYNAMSLPLLFLNFADFAKKRVNLKKFIKVFETIYDGDIELVWLTLEHQLNTLKID